MESVEDDYSIFGLTAPKQMPITINPVAWAPQGSTWRDKNQELWIADGEGIFTHAESGKKKAEGWTGEAPGHGLIRVACIAHATDDECEDMIRLTCEPAKAEEWPPGEEDLAELIMKCQAKGKTAGWLAKLLEQHGVEVEALAVSGWAKRVRMTWAQHRAVYKDIFVARLMDKERPEYKGEHEHFVEQEKITDAEQTTWVDEQKHYEATQSEVEIGADAIPSKASEVAQEWEAEAAPMLPAVREERVIVEGVVTEDGEITDLSRWMELAGIAERFAVKDDASAEWLLERIRGVQKQVEEIVLQTPLMIQVRLNAIAGLCQYYSVDLTNWGEPKLQKWASDSKPEAKNPHKKGDYKAKNVRTPYGALFFKKVGGAKQVLPLETKLFVESLKPSQYAEYGVSKTFLVTLPVGYDIEIYAVGDDQPIDSEQYQAHGISLKRDLKYAKKVMAARVEAGEKIQGYEVVPANELGQVTIGGERAWSWNTVLKSFKEKFKTLTMRGETSDSEDDDDE